ncbi:MAG: PIN domain-containing protein [Trueperaceae bacterium]|nr:PIN domain-containing protein [Trueperaceae bacterium]
MAERSFVDTNLFLRYLTNDVPEQAEAVERLLMRAEAGELRLETNRLVIAEVVWTLESVYKKSKREVREAVLAILNTPGLVVEVSQQVLQAAVWYEEKNVDFADACIAAQLLDQGPAAVHTFNRRHFARFPHLDVLSP